MIASRDEFLLLLTKWRNSSAKVFALLLHGGSGSTNPLSSAFILTVPGQIIAIDDNASFFALESGENGLVSVGFEEAEFHFETALDLEPSFADFLSFPAEVDEMATILLPSGLKLSCLTLK